MPQRLCDMIYQRTTTRQKPEPIPTPAWPEVDGKLFVVAPTAADRAIVDRDQARNPKDPNVYARWAVRVTVDASGQPVFPLNDEQAVAQLGDDDTGTVIAIVDKAFELARMTREAAEAIRKNLPSPEMPGAITGSDSSSPAT